MTTTTLTPAPKGSTCAKMVSSGSYYSAHCGNKASVMDEVYGKVQPVCKAHSVTLKAARKGDRAKLVADVTAAAKYLTSVGRACRASEENLAVALQMASPSDLIGARAEDYLVALRLYRERLMLRAQAMEARKQAIARLTAAGIKLTNSEKAGY